MKHLNNKPLIGVCYWEGKMPSYIHDTIRNNAEILDKLYLITDNTKLTIHQNVIKLDSSLFNQYLNDEFNYEFHPAAKSDILCYSVLRVLKLYNIEVTAAVYVDCDYWLYNKFTLRELFTYGYDFFCSKGKNFYKRFKDDYVNTCFSFHHIDNINNENNINKIFSIIHDIIDKDDLRYTAFGPSLINSDDKLFQKLDVFFSNIQPCDLDPRVLFKGRNRIKFNPEGLGVHFMPSLIHEIGFKIYRVYKEYDELIIDLDE